MADKGRKGELSLFDIFEEEGKEVIEKKLNVVRADFIEVEQMAWKELFSGYNKLWAITYSSGINFVYSLLDMFDEAEVIFGFEKVISPSLHDIIAYQNKVIERMRNKMGKKKERLLDKIDSEAVRFFVAHEKLSHEKIYLLQSDDGSKRVITGSANMSFNAFGGKQRESIIVMDGDAAFDSYLEIFEDLQINSTDIISRKALEIADLDEHIEQLPILDAIKKEKVTVIEAITGDDEEEIQFVLDVQDIAKRLQPNMPKMEKSGIIRITPTEIVRMKKRVCDVAVKEKERLSEKPQLVVDVFDKTVTLNGKPYNLEPSKDEIKADVELFLQYMDGYNKFHGDSNSSQRQYYIFANWFFCSPFMATMRTLALNSDHNPLPYPVFGLVYGQSKAGKTSFLETLLKMMIGQKPKMAAPDFTHSVIEALKMEVKGAPIIVDDLTNTRFTNHAIEMIKNESFGVNERLFHYPAVVISANEDVKAVAPEIRRRTVVCRVEAGLTNTEVMRSNTVRTVQKKIGTAFYREYIRRMFEQIPDLIEALQKENGENMPDILKVSSEVLYCIIQEYVGQLPHYVVPLTIDNYFSEKVTGKFVIDTIKNAWATNKRNFKIDKKNNKLSYDAGDVHEVTRLMKELPETLEARKARDCLIMNLQAAKEFFGIDFKKGFFG